MDDATQAGAMTILAKPVRLERLREALNSVPMTLPILPLPPEIFAA